MPKQQITTNASATPGGAYSPGLPRPLKNKPNKFWKISKRFSPQAEQHWLTLSKSAPISPTWRISLDTTTYMRNISQTRNPHAQRSGVNCSAFW